jgi:type II secretory pathway pseudopilin PulG
MRRNEGFSLIELMVSAVIVIIVMVGITRAFTTQHQTYVVVDQVTEAQQNLRAVVDLIERDVRRAGFMVPLHAAVCGWDQTTGPDTLFVSNTDAILTVFDLEGAGEDLSGDLGAPVNGVTTGWGPTTGGSFSFTLARTWVDVADADGDSTTDVDFAVGEGVILVASRQQDGPAACGIIDTIAGTTLTADFGSTRFISGAAGENAGVVAIPAHVYQVVAGTPSQLRRDGRLLASDVEDFQLTYFLDLDDDRVVDSGESFATSGGTAQAWEISPAPDFSTLREVGINIVTATRADDPNSHYQIGAGQVTGNRTAASLPSGDGKRRRVSTARVRVRNAS